MNCVLYFWKAKLFLLSCLIISFCLALPISIHAKPKNPTKDVEVVFVLDTTGSMTSLIDGAKKKIWSIANTIVDQYPDATVRMGLVGYRDLDDEYVTKHFPLTTDIQGIYAHLLGFEANGGGDTPESVNEALDIAVTKMGWSDLNNKQTKRIIFLVGDAPPHMDYPQDRKYPAVVAEAKQRGIIVNTVLAGDSLSTLKIWQEIAKLGNGTSLEIPQSGGTIITIVTPYDEDIRRIQIELNTTVIPYGTKMEQAKVVSKTGMYADAPASSSADMSKYVNKSSKGGKVITGEGDLVADVVAGKVKIADIPKAELPENLQALSAEKQNSYVIEQNAKRMTLAKDLESKISQRDAFIAEESKKTTEKPAQDSFDTAVSKTLEKQIAE